MCKDKVCGVDSYCNTSLDDRCMTKPADCSTTAINKFECQCSNVTCPSNYCIKNKDDKGVETGSCTDDCKDLNGKMASAEATCMCKSTVCNKGAFCNASSAKGTCQTKQTCETEDGKQATNDDCICGDKTCETNQMCKKTGETHQCLFA